MTHPLSNIERAPRLGDPQRPGYEACTGCGVCVLPCPVWRQTHDVMLTLLGRAKALQRGAPLEEIAESVAACVLCGACEPVCPEDIDTVGMMIDLRAMLARRGVSPLSAAAAQQMQQRKAPQDTPAPSGATWLLPGLSVRANEKFYKDIVSIFEQGGDVLIAADDGSDIAIAIEAGLLVASERRARFVRSLQGAGELIVADGILHRTLRQCLPGVRVIGLGEALLRLAPIRNALQPTDLYVIETRGYHAEFRRLVHLYDRLRQQAGCVMNLDLQRAAIPTGAASLQVRLGLDSIDPCEQARWILEGRQIKRVVVESLADGEPFKQTTQLPVVHLAELAAAEAPA